MKMQVRRTIGGVLALAAMMLLAVGCVQNGADHETTQSNIETNVQSLSQRVDNSARFIESSKVVSNSYSLYSSAIEGEASSPGESATTDSEVEVDTKPYSQELVDGLLKYVFIEDNIVNETNRSVTYKVKGSNSCGEKGSSGYSECVEHANEFDVRIRVTQPKKGELHFEVMIGPDRYNPVDVELSKTHVAAIANLGEIKKSIQWGNNVFGGESIVELPEVMKGRLRAELASRHSKHAHFELKVEAKLQVSDANYGLELAKASKPVFGITANGKNETLSTSVDFNAIDIGYPMPHFVDLDDDGEEEEKTLDYLVHMAGLSGQTTLQAGDDVINVEEIGFGDSTSWLKIDGKKAFTGDLNPNDGRSLDLTVRPNQDGLMFEVEPALEVLTTFDVSHVSDILDVYDWAEVYEFSGKLSGANPVKVLANQEMIKLVDGTLDLGSVDPDASVMVDEGQCLLEVDDSSSNSGSDHPLSYVKSGSCPSN